MMYIFCHDMETPWDKTGYDDDDEWADRDDDAYHSRIDNELMEENENQGEY